MSGSAAHRGAQVGLQFSNEMQKLFEIRMRILLQGSDESPERIMEICSRLWESVRIHVPEVWEEVNATRLAANMAGWQMIVLGAYTDVSDFLTHRMMNVHECTVLAEGNRRIVRGTWDSHAEAGDFSLVLVREHGDWRSAALTTVGWPAQFGVNSDGLVFAITNLTPQSTNLWGIPYIAAVSQVSLMKSTNSALKWLESVSFASGHSYVLSAPDGLALLESSGEGSMIVESLGGDIIETNHYVSSLDDNSNYDWLAGSERRALEMRNAPRIYSFLEWKRMLSKSRWIFRADPRSQAVTSAVFSARGDERRLEVWWPSDDFFLDVAL